MVLNYTKAVRMKPKTITEVFNKEHSSVIRCFGGGSTAEKGANPLPLNEKVKEKVSEKPLQSGKFYFKL